MTRFNSPLRYPGGKGKLSSYIELIIEQNLLSDGHYVEPYAGGASVALSLLYSEHVRSIHINDYDPRIYAFWDSIINETDSFCKKIEKTKISITNWKRQKHIQNNLEKFSNFEIGFSTFFLNRTNRSGILKAGVIGGLSQLGNWKIDARFNKDDLIKRIERIARYKSRIHIYNLDAIELLNKIKKTIPKKSLIYFDPPYYKKGKDLYINFYEHKDHLEIAKVISKLKNQNWIVSYDNNLEISKMYDKFYQRTYNLNYHAASPSIGTEVMIFSEDLIIPDIDQPTNKSELKKFKEFGLRKKWLKTKKICA